MLSRKVARAINTVVRRVASPIRWVCYRILGGLATTHYADGLRIDNHDQNAQLVGKVEEALTLIRTLDPRRYQRIRQDLAVVIVLDRDLPGVNAKYWHEARACVLTRETVRDHSDAIVASCIVHEATHARLERAGVHYFKDLRPRIEARCVREELSFAERLGGEAFPGAEAYRESLRKRMSMLLASNAAAA